MSAHFIFRFNRIVRDVEADVGLNLMGARARALLSYIGEENAHGSTPKMGDLTAQSRFGTPPTIYASLDELEEGGWIERRRDESDARARRVQMTARAKRAFARISRLVEREI